MGRKKKIFRAILLGIFLTAIFLAGKFLLPLILICTGAFFLYFGGKSVHLKHYYATKISVVFGAVLVLCGMALLVLCII